MKNPRLVLAKLALPALLISLVAGCGGHDFGPIGEIQGTLTMDGKPMPVDTKLIFMHGSKGYAGFAFTDQAGGYSIQWRREGTTFNGLPVGEYDVMLVPANAVDVDEMSADEMLDGGPGRVKKTAIPTKYRRTTTSGLTYTIGEKINVIDIDISRK